MKKRLHVLFGADLRSLALMRIAVGLLLLVDLGIRATALRAHYTDWGVAPREALVGGWRVSLHMLGGGWEWQAFLFVLAAVAAVFLTLGLHTRVATVVSWLLLLSLHRRNPLVLQSGDTILRCLLFWAMFLPWGRRFSVDARRRPVPESDSVLSAATFAYAMQVALVYVFTAQFKSGPEWHSEGTAILYALRLDIFATPFGRFLTQFPDVLRVLTHFVYALERVGPLLLFCPFFTAYVRTLTILLFWFFHAGLELCMTLGLFPWISIVSLVGLIPGLVWERGAGLLRRPTRAARTVAQTQRVASGPLLTAGRVAGHAALLVLLGYVIFWNLNTLHPFRWRLPERGKVVGQLLGLDQRWDMFSPQPPKQDGWFVVPGKLRNGDEVDLFRDGENVRWGKPAYVSSLYPTARWRKLGDRMWRKSGARVRADYARFLCRSWNVAHAGDGELTDVEIFFVQEETLDELTEGKPWRVSLLRHRCRDDERDQPWRLRWDPAVGARMRGAVDAPVTVVEFCNYESLFCEASHRAVLELVDEFPGSVRVAFRHFARSFDEETSLAQRAALAAGRQGRFWEMHDRIRNDPDDLQRPALLAHAEALGLDLGRFQSDLDDAAFEEVLRDDWERARECGVHRLPTFVVDGRLVPEGKETASVRTFIAAGLRGRPPPDPSH
jgi:hypothetical protein